MCSKRIFALLAAVVLLLSAASCGKTESAPKATGVVSRIVGMYECDRCAVNIEKLSDTEASVYAMWGQKVLMATEWKLTGTYDPQTRQLLFVDCVCTDVTYDEHGSVAKEVVEYENGSGYLQFSADGTFTWESEQEAERMQGMTFSIGATE
ncbi:MAG: hypothetical protein IJT44_05070 [Clostridia bacterium]|nr:hypothetical protein [Clostridia bacterium]